MTAWVLLRGLAREAGHWGGFVPALAAWLEAGDELLALDLPGNGSLCHLASPATVSGMVQACRANLSERGRSPPVMLVALSLGGMVALEWALAFPDEVAGCVLINTSVASRAPLWERLRPRNCLRLLGLLAPGRSPLAREHEVLAMTSADPERHAGLAAVWAAIARERPVSRLNFLRQLMAAARYAPSRQEPPGTPVLLLASAGDGLVSARCSQRLAQRWALPLHLHRSAGHDLPLDEPEWVIRHVMDWWRSSPGVRA